MFTTSSINIPIIPDDSISVFNFQQCIIGSFSLIENIIGFDGIYESYASIKCCECDRNSDTINSRFKILNRLSLGRTLDAHKVLKCNVRVLELLISSECDSDSTREVECALGKQIIQMKTGWNNDSENSLNLFTSIDKIQLLKSGPIKLMRVTIIISTYPDNYKYYENEKINKSLSKIIWTILQTYDIRLRPKTLVDLRDCPMSKSFSIGKENHTSLNISPDFIFLDECRMKHLDTLIGRVNSQTQIFIERIHHVDYYIRLVESLRHDNSALDFSGVERVYEKLKGNVKIQVNTESKDHIRLSQGLLVAGPSGSGKTRAIFQTAKVLQANLLIFKITYNKMLQFKDEHTTSRFSKSSSLNEIFVKAIRSGYMYPTILLIEGLELLHWTHQGVAGKNKKSQSSKKKENLVKHLCNLFDSVPSYCSLTIVATTSKAHLIPARLRIFPRLQQEVTINVPVESVRLKMLESLTKKTSGFETADLNSIAQRTPGFVAADLMRLIQRTFQKMKDEECNSVSEPHIKYALAHVFPSALQGSVGLVDIQRVTSLDHIAGLASVKLDLIKAIVWPLMFPHAFLTMGIQPSKGILLYGPPGNGKTTLVRALAASHQTNFLSVSAAGLFSSGVGDSEKIVAHLFHRARMASPCILFLDELDSIVGARVSSGTGKSKSINDTILSMLLTEMDGIGVPVDTITTSYDEENGFCSPRVIVVGATNRPDLIDSALLRPGRFDRIVAVPPPDEAGRLDILLKSTEKTHITEDVDLEKLARETEGYSGSDLTKLVREAALFALAEDINRSSVSMEHYIKAKAELPPSLSFEYLRSFYEYSTCTSMSSSSSVSTIEHLTNRINTICL